MWCKEDYWRLTHLGYERLTEKQTNLCCCEKKKKDAGADIEAAGGFVRSPPLDRLPNNAKDFFICLLAYQQDLNSEFLFPRLVASQGYSLLCCLSHRSMESRGEFISFSKGINAKVNLMKSAHRFLGVFNRNAIHQSLIDPPLIAFHIYFDCRAFDSQIFPFVQVLLYEILSGLLVLFQHCLIKVHHQKEVLCSFEVLPVFNYRRSSFSFLGVDLTFFGISQKDHPNILLGTQFREGFFVIPN